MSSASFASLLKKIRACELCAEHLPLGPRPIVQASPRSRILLIGQAPGTRVHESGVPWDDPSGRRLREWLQVEPARFYDPNVFALVPMGFCYPGRGRSGDLPPRPECAPEWHGPLLKGLKRVRLTLLVGQSAQAGYLGESRKGTLTETVRAFGEYEDRGFPLPHPSPRNNIWLRKNPWFEKSVLPALSAQVKRALA